MVSRRFDLESDFNSRIEAVLALVGEIIGSVKGKTIHLTAPNGFLRKREQQQQQQQPVI